MRPDVRVLPDAAAAAAAAARLVQRIGADALAAGRGFSLALSGGRTPEGLYERLDARSLDWGRTDAYFGDERCVAPTDPSSNYATAARTLLSRVPIAADRVHRIEGERGAVPAAARYEALLKARFSATGPALDLVLLGLGADGHTASLFPGAVDPGEPRWVLPARAPAGTVVLDRVTLSLAFLRRSRHALFLVAGEEKAAAVAAALEGGGAGSARPAALVTAVEAVHWVLDAAAAARLTAGSPAPGGRA